MTIWDLEGGAKAADLPGPGNEPEVPRRRLRTAAASGKGKVERRVRDQSHGIDPYARSFASLADLQTWTNERIAARSRQRRCPATGTTVAEA